MRSPKHREAGGPPRLTHFLRAAIEVSVGKSTPLSFLRHNLRKSHPWPAPRRASDAGGRASAPRPSRAGRRRGQQPGRVAGCRARVRARLPAVSRVPGGLPTAGRLGGLDAGMELRRMLSSPAVLQVQSRAGQAYRQQMALAPGTNSLPKATRCPDRRALLPRCLSLLVGAPGCASGARIPGARDSPGVAQRQVWLLFLSDSTFFSLTEKILANSCS